MKFNLVTRLLPVASTAIVAMLSASAAHAADVTGDVSQAGGWYLGAAAGSAIAGTQTLPGFGIDDKDYMTSGDAEADYVPNFTGLLTIGHAFDNGFRLEVEGGLRNDNANVVNKGNIEPGYAPGGSDDGIVRKDGSIESQTYTLMLNGFYEFDLGDTGLRPYVGAGLGYGWQNIDNMHVKTTFDDFGDMETLGWQMGSQTASGFAYQAIAGVALPVSDRASITAEYRWTQVLNGGDVNASISCADDCPDHKLNTEIGNYGVQSLLVGLRYEFGR